MQSFSLPSKLPSTPTRRGACTHMTLKRLYGTYQCTHCNRQSPFGWVYRCTQDCDAELLNHQDELEPSLETLLRPISDSRDDKDEVLGTLIKPSSDVSDVVISPWMEKAIADGHYTSAQVSILRSQRQRVRECVAEAEDSLKRNRRPSFVESMGNWMTPLPPLVSLLDATSSVAGGVVGNSLMSRDSFPRTSSRSSISTASKRVSLRRTKITPDCTYKTCQLCRPTSRDRAWQCFDHVLNRTNTAIPNFLTDNRPLSDSNIVRTIGLFQPSSRSELLDYDSISDSGSDSQYERYVTPSTHHGSWTTEELDDLKAKQDTTRPTHGKENGKEPGEDVSIPQQALHKGLRHTLRRTFHGMLTGTRRSSRRSTPSNLSAPSSQKIREEPEDEVVDKGLWWRQNLSTVDLVGMLTVGKENKEILEHGERGEVRVEDGIAVTEEGVDLGTADIIMQV